MSKFCYTFILCLVLSSPLFAQTGGVSIGKNGDAAHADAILDMVSTSKGILIPRMSSSQREAIFEDSDSSAKGLLVFDTVKNSFFYWDGSAWKNIASTNAKIVSGTPSIAGAAGEMAFDGTNSILYVHTGQIWAKATGESGSKVNLTPMLNASGVLYLGTQDSKALEVDLSSLKVVSATGINVTPNTQLGLSASNVQDALMELQGEIVTAAGGGMLSVVHDKSLEGNGIAGLPLLVAEKGIDTKHLADGAVTGAKLADGSVSTTKVVDKSITIDKLASNSVSSEKILDNAITNDKLADGVVTKNEISSGAVSYDKIQPATGMSRLLGSSATTTVIGEISLGTGLSMSGTTLNATGVNTVGSNVTSAGTIAVGNGTGATLTAMTIDLAQNAVSSSYLADGAVSTVKMANNAVADTKLKGITASGTSGQVLTSDGTGGFTWATAATGGMTSVVTDGITITGNGNSTPLALGNLSWNNITTGKPSTLSGYGINDALAKPTVAGTDGQVLTLVGSTPTWKDATASSTTTLTGAVTGSGTGSIATTLGANVVGSSNITDGSITAADLASNAVTPTKLNGIAGNGTTGQVLTSNGSGAFAWGNSLTNPMTTAGDLIINNASGAASRLAAGSNGYVLTMEGGVPTWAAATGSVTGQNVTSTGSITVGNGAGAALTAMTLDIASGGVAATHLASNAVTTAKIVDGTIAAADIAANAITEAKLSVSNTGSSGQVLTSDGSGGFTWADASDGGGSGTVSSVSGSGGTT
ncbi:MAG: beta strand repeat-containing protein [Mangrovibacterium sp.]